MSLFGCGGDRDKGKRPLMGAIAVKLADDVIVTDDNPRTEDAATIRAEILAAAPGAREIGDRHEAIRAAVAALGTGDVLILAGKGHESGQYINGVTYPFSDRDEALKAALAPGRARGMTLWSSADAESATLGKASKRLCRKRAFDRHPHAEGRRPVRGAEGRQSRRACLREGGVRRQGRRRTGDAMRPMA